MTLTDFFDRIFIINLARREDRWNECLDELRRNEIPMAHVERVNAVEATNGHHGCVASHRALLRFVADGPWRRVLVLEDDFKAITLQDLIKGRFKPDYDVWKTFCTILDGKGNLNERFAALAAWLPDVWDVLYLGAGYGEPPICRMNEHLIRCGFMQTTSSYGITKEFAGKWTEAIDKICAEEGGGGPIDNLFGKLAHVNLYYVFQPRLIFQRESKSDLDGGTNSRLGQMCDPHHEAMV